MGRQQKMESFLHDDDDFENAIYRQLVFLLK